MCWMSLTSGNLTDEPSTGGGQWRAAAASGHAPGSAAAGGHARRAAADQGVEPVEPNQGTGENPSLTPVVRPNANETHKPANRARNWWCVLSRRDLAK